MKIAVIGTGYVGLVTGTCLAENGNSVTCVDINEQKINKLRAGEVTIYEPGLETLFERNLKQRRLNFTTSLSEGVQGAQIIFLALPTPSGSNGEADLHYVLDVAALLGPLLKDYTVIVDKSTVPVGTSEKVRAVMTPNCTVEFDVISNPEFLREGAAIEDFMKPERIVVGTSSERAANVMRELYAPFVRQGNPIIVMDERSAELTKYAANAFLATKISFMNEIANICERLGADVDAVRSGIGTDSRIGKRFLFAGIGYGGSCFPKDVRALAKSSEEVDYDFEILKSVISVNEKQRTSMIQSIKNHFNNDLKGKTIALWGLAFKPQTDDIREAPALYNIESLIGEGCRIKAHDPEAMGNVKLLYDDQVEFFDNKYDALIDADALLIATEWSVFRTPDFNEMGRRMKEKVIFDGRNLYDLNSMQALGFTYCSVGRKKVKGVNGVNGATRVNGAYEVNAVDELIAVNELNGNGHE